MSPFRAYRPHWFSLWRAMHAEGEHAIQVLSYTDIAHRIRLLTTLGDVDRCTDGLRARVMKRILADHTTRLVFPSGTCSWNFPPVHLKLQLRSDAGGRRMCVLAGGRLHLLLPTFLFTSVFVLDASCVIRTLKTSRMPRIRPASMRWCRRRQSELSIGATREALV